jgi:hypothetical protein
VRFAKTEQHHRFFIANASSSRTLLHRERFFIANASLSRNQLLGEYVASFKAVPVH